MEAPAPTLEPASVAGAGDAPEVSPPTGPEDILLAVQDILALDEMPFSRVAAAFARHSAKDHGHAISRESFAAALRDLHAVTRRALEAQNVPFDAAAVAAELDALAPQLYALCDTDGDGKLSAPELAAGLVALSGGEPRDKAVTLFRLFDLDGSGTITPAEMETCVGAILKTQRVLAGAPPAGVELPPVEAVAKATTAACFADADKDGNGVLTLDEYLEWYLADSKA